MLWYWNKFSLLTLSVFILITSPFLSPAYGELIHTFDDPTITTEDHFGHSVAIDGNYVLVGSPLDDTRSFRDGQAHLFDATTGALLLTFVDPTLGILGSGTTSSDETGFSVAIDGDLVLLGAPRDSSKPRPGCTVGCTEVGQAYLYNKTTCDDDTSNGGTAGDKVCEAALHIFDDPTPTTRDFFGFTVSISGNLALVGAHLDDTIAFRDIGQAHLFDATTGALLLTFNDPVHVSGSQDNFAFAVAIDGNNVIISDQLESFGSPFFTVGQAHLFDVTTCDADTSNGGAAGDKHCEAALHILNDPTPTERRDRFTLEILLL